MPINAGNPQSPRLALPLLVPGQAAKHITVNEALLRLDSLVNVEIEEAGRTSPPDAPEEGEVVRVLPSATGPFAERDGELAVYVNGHWDFATPVAGQTAWVRSTGETLVFDGTQWSAPTLPDRADRLGINASASDGQRLALASDTSLFNHGDSGSHRLTLNREGENDTATLVFQTAFSGRSEIGLSGADGLSVKASADGAEFVSVLRVPPAGEHLAIDRPILSDAQLGDPSNSRFGIGALDGGQLTRGGGTQGLRNTAIGHNALHAAGTASNNVGVGYGAMSAVTTGGSNVAIGARALEDNTTGGANTAIGYFALGASVSGSFNTAVGYASSLQSQSGVDNTGLGAFTLYQSQTGSQNTAVGSNTLRNNVAGSSNTAIGSGALYSTDASYNTAIGGNNLRRHLTGNGNSALGHGAAFALEDGASNTAVGRSALGKAVTGSSNTAVGNDALSFRVDGAMLTGLSNCTGIGAGARVSGSNQVQLGNSATTTYAFGPVQQRSDRRDKRDIAPSQLGLDFILALEAVDYVMDYRDDYSDGERDGRHARTRRHCGFIAQQVEDACNRLGVDFSGLQHHAHGGGGDDVYSLGYTAFIAPLVAAVQALHARVEALEGRS